jgi:prepilin-type N-terminal cleavage/methylation domain-containing protein
VDSAMRRAFTLTELVVAMGVAALLATLSLAAYGYAQRQARINGDLSTAQSILQAVSAFYAVNGCYPADVGPGQMPPGLSPYLGGQWPGSNTWPSNSLTYDYDAWTSANGGGASSGQTAYYIGVQIIDPVAGYSPLIWIVNNSPVPIC